MRCCLLMNLKKLESLANCYDYKMIKTLNILEHVPRWGGKSKSTSCQDTSQNPVMFYSLNKNKIKQGNIKLEVNKTV